MLVGRLGATLVSVGENFRFGHRAQGDPQLLRADGRFETRVVPLLEVDGEIVSSSHIRGLVAGGALEYAGTLLGAPFAVDGPVEHGDERGRTLGFPTANLVPRDGYCTPGHGVYACRARTGGRRVARRPSTSACGPMFESGRGELIEAYLLDFDGDLYGKPLRVEFLKRLRGERRFASVDALVEQMRRDVEETRAVGAPRRPELGARARRQRCCYPRAPHEHPVTREDARDRHAASAPARPTPAARASRWRCSPSASTISPSICARTRRTTHRAAAC